MKPFYKLLFVLLCVFIITDYSFARRGNPVPTQSGPRSQFYLVDSDDNHAQTPVYKFVDTTVGTWVRLTGFTNQDNGYKQVFPPPADSFEFNFSDQLVVLPPRYFSVNGHVSFDTFFTAVNNDLPPVDVDSNFRSFAAALWSDLEFRSYGDSSNVYYRMTADTCYVSYYNAFLKGTNGKARATFQIVFCRTDSSVTFMYKSFDGDVCGSPAAKLFQDAVTISCSGYLGTFATNYLHKGTYYARTYGSIQYAKDLHNGLAVRFMRYPKNLCRAITVSDPPSDGYETTMNPFIPKVKVENLTDTTRRIVVKNVLMNLTTGINIYSRTDSMNVDPGTITEISTSQQSGIPCGAYRLTSTISMPSRGDDSWVPDNITTRDFYYLSRPTVPVFDDYATFDRCNFIHTGDTRDSSHLLFHQPAAPYNTGAIILDRRDANGLTYRTAGLGDTLTVAPIDLTGKSNVWFIFSLQRGLVTDSNQAGITNRVLSGPEPLQTNGSGGVIRGDSLIIEALPSSAPIWNPAGSSWVKIGTIYGGLDLRTTKYRIQIPSTYVHSRTRVRIRLSATNNNPTPCGAADDNDAFAIDGLQISAPVLGLKNESDLEPISFELGAGNYTHIPRDVKKLFPKVKIASNGLGVNQTVYGCRLIIKDNLNREVYHRTASYTAPIGRSDTLVKFPEWNIEGSQGGRFKATCFIEQCFTDYRRANDTAKFEQVLYIDDTYALDDNKADSAGTLVTADQNFYYTFKPMVSDSLRGYEFYHLSSSGTTNWTTTIRNMQGNTLVTRSFSYNVLTPGWWRQTFTPYYLNADSTYRIQFQMTQGSNLGGDASKGLVWVKTDNGTTKTYDALYPVETGNFRDNNDVPYFTSSAAKNSSGGGPLLPMMRIVFKGSSTYLPVELISFEASRLSSGDVNLHFRTASEENLSSFEVEREVGDVWEQVGVVSGKNSSNGANYSLIDDDAPRFATHYRLWETDLDGSRKVIGTAAAAGMPGVETLLLTVYPNPASRVMYALVHGAGEGSTLTMYDITGSVVKRYNNIRDGRTELDITNIAEGTYYLELITQDGNVKAKVVVTK